MPIPPVLYDSHMHTPLCKHASGTPDAYAAVGYKRGLKGIIFTCHNPTIDGWSTSTRMRVDQFDEYLDLIARTREEWQGKLDVRVGLECDYYPGSEDWLHELCGRAPLHHVLGSVHPMLPDYKERYLNGDVTAFQHTYFEHLALAAETGLFDTLSHPDLVKNIFPKEWDPERLMPVIGAALDRIAATGVAMELNTSGLNKTVREMNPGRLILAEMQAREIPVVLGSDSHEPRRVGIDFDTAMETLKVVGYTQVSFFLDRKRHDVAIDTALASLVMA